jgi:hypothetical protein
VGNEVVYFVEALGYTVEGRGYYGVTGVFFIKIIPPAHYCPAVNSGSNRKEYQGCFLEVKATGA